MTVKRQCGPLRLACLGGLDVRGYGREQDPVQKFGWKTEKGKT